jgi:hypothetical protein
MLAGSQSADAVRSGWGCLACRPPLPYGRVRISSRWPFGSSKYTPRVIPVVDPARVLPGGIRPVRSVAAAGPLEDLVEFLLADQERVVQLVDVPVHGDEVERRVRLTWRTANSPRWVGGSKPRVSAKNRAVASLSRARTMWWFNTAMATPWCLRRRAIWALLACAFGYPRWLAATGRRCDPRPAPRSSGFGDGEPCGECKRGDVPGGGTDENGIEAQEACSHTVSRWRPTG